MVEYGRPEANPARLGLTGSRSTAHEEGKAGGTGTDVSFGRSSRSRRATRSGCFSIVFGCRLYFWKHTMANGGKKGLDEPPIVPSTAKAAETRGKEGRSTAIELHRHLSVES